MQNTVTQLRLTKTRAWEIISKSATDSANVQITIRAEKMMAENNISDQQVIECLRLGTLKGSPRWSEEFIDWVCTVNWYCSGQDIDVGVALDRLVPGCMIFVTHVIKR